MNFAEYGKAKRYDQKPELLDIHVARMLEAHRVVGSYMKPSPLLESGLIRKEKVFGPEVAKAIMAEAEAIPPKDGKDSGSMLANMPSSTSFNAAVPIFHYVCGFFQERLRKELMFLYAHHAYLQHLYNRPDDGDEQKVFHSDTFFPAVKFWYFPHPVKEEDGPFWYVPNSVKLTEGLIGWHKKRVDDLKNGKAEDWRGPSHKQGSFRINDQELAEIGLKAEPVVVDGDTLIVANVFGFHKRGDTVKPTHRIALHGNLRISNPFEH